MTASLHLCVPDLADPLQREDFFAVAEAAAEADGADPFDEQARLDLTAGRRSPVGGVVTGGPADGRTVAAAILGRGELAVAVDPLFRGMGFGEKAAEGLLATTRGPLTAWSHGDHPGARRLAERFGFDAVRTLLRLTAEVTAPASPADAPAGFTLGTMRPGVDDAEWVELNARIFADHPEQGRLTVDDLRARQAEPWFDAEDVLLLRDETGRLVGYDWVKVEPGAPGEAPSGEIYVLGVERSLAGRGLGRALLGAGMARLAQREARAVHLYVEASNEAAVALYRSAGFTTGTADVQYRRQLD